MDNDEAELERVHKAARRDEHQAKPRPATHASPADLPRTLAIDVGGTHLKAVVLSPKGKLLVEELVVDTPHPCPPETLMKAIDEFVATLPAFDRVSIGFPGFVRRGLIATAPHLGTRPWKNFALAEALTTRLAKPVRVLNDADVQGFGLIQGRGLEMVMTLGTGVGTALFRDGELMPHLELAHHPIHNDKTYDEYLGDDVLRRKGVKKWSRRVHKTITILRSLVHYDVLHIGGGNASRIIDPPDDVKIGSNQAGLTGGIRLWDSDDTEFAVR